MITPTIGRRVWFWPSQIDRLGGDILNGMNSISGDQAFDAGVVYVHDDRMVNLSITDHLGEIHKRENVQLLQDDDKPEEGYGYAEWMPYQLKTNLSNT